MTDNDRRSQTPRPLEELTLTVADDWHLHVRDGAALATVVPHSARQFARAIIMPNLSPPVVSVAAALAYRQRILAALPEGVSFDPLMTLYLTDSMSPDEIRRAGDCEHVVACKLYPAGATTGSDSGVTDVARISGVLAEMERQGLVLCVHGEVTDPDVDMFDREAIFIERVLESTVRDFPNLKIVFEHITTTEAVDFVAAASPTVAATLTPQHLMFNRNALFVGGIRPHYYCLPILKRESHRKALVRAAVSGNPKYFLGTDSAPHARNTKEAACGCAGCYSAWHALELYAEVFDDANALGQLEAFASFYGADFYGLERNSGTLSLIRESHTVPESFRYADSEITPLASGRALRFRLKNPRQ
ncbi:MAG: dihydroorotase [marine bacterium B5-7]|nr:MAG: dihydroorotase [marine bacterium B5-7]